MFNLQASAGICKDTCRELPGMLGGGRWSEEKGRGKDGRKMIGEGG